MPFQLAKALAHMGTPGTRQRIPGWKGGKSSEVNQDQLETGCSVRRGFVCCFKVLNAKGKQRPNLQRFEHFKNRETSAYL